MEKRWRKRSNAPNQSPRVKLWHQPPCGLNRRSTSSIDHFYDCVVNMSSNNSLLTLKGILPPPFQSIITLSIALFFFTTGCSPISVKPDKDFKITRDPDYIETLEFYWFGLVGQQHLDIDRICFGREAEYIHNEFTPGDISVAAKTLFIYVPRTVKVWCKEDSHNRQF